MDLRNEFNKNKTKGMYNYKILKGCSCCGRQATQIHHILPLSLGGDNRESNLVALCDECHNKIHGRKHSLKMSELTKQGKEKAKQANPNWKEGRPKAYTKEQLDHALNMLTINGGGKSYFEVADITGISKSTLIRENNKRKAKKI